MGKFIKDNFIVIIAVLLPIVFLFIAILIIYLPSFFVSTDYDLLYTCKNQLDYSILDGNLEIRNRDGRVFIYDVSKNYSNEISLEEAKEKTISPISTSPDGVNFVIRSSRGDKLFYYQGGGYNYFLENETGSKKINLVGCDSSYYRDNVDFIGWILNNN